MGSPAIVKLLAPGADPKTPLRYKVPAGFKTAGVVSLTMGLTMNMGGMALPSMDLPTMKMTFDLAVTGVTPAGDVTDDLAFTDMTTGAAPGLDPSVAAMVQGSAAAIKEIRGTSTINNRGVIRSTTFDVSKMSDPNLKQALEQVSQPARGHGDAAARRGHRSRRALGSALGRERRWHEHLCAERRTSLYQ